MLAPAGPVLRRRSGRSLIALFGLTILFPGLLLAALGVRTVRQERRLADQQLRERLDRAADIAVRDLEREVREWQSALEQIAPDDAALDALPARLRSALTDAGSGIVIRRGHPGQSVWPERQLLYDPRPASLSVPAVPTDRVWADAEFAELRDHDYARAIHLYQRVAVIAAAPQVRAAALQRAARTLRKAGRDEDALAAYRQLAISPERIGALPADLIARYEICSLLAAEGASALLAPAARDLYRDLIDGRWRLEKARFLHYAASARRFLEADPSSRAELARWTASEEQKASLTEAAAEWLDEGNLRTPAASERFVVVQTRGAQPVTLLLSRAWLAANVWPRTFKFTLEGGFDVMLSGPGGQVMFATRPAGAPGSRPQALAAVRMIEDAHIPWRVGITPHDPAAFAADASRRQQVYLVMLGLVLALLGSGSYLTLRVVRNEMEIAKLQSDFVSTVSHEFRSPLTAIRQLSELLARGRVPSDKRRQEYYERITRESDRLTRLVENVLDFSQINEGRKEYRFERIDTAEWLRSILDEARAFNANAPPHVVARIPETLPPLEADRAALGCALHNLIDNAVKYSPGRDAVWVEAEALDGQVAIRVRDEGVGVNERDRRHIFEKFYRGQTDITQEVKGAGLGLSLVAQIVQAHGGAVNCESRLGEGTTFTIHLNAASPTGGG